MAIVGEHQAHQVQYKRSGQRGAVCRGGMAVPPDRLNQIARMQDHQPWIRHGSGELSRLLKFFAPGTTDNQRGA